MAVNVDDPVSFELRFGVLAIVPATVLEIVLHNGTSTCQLSEQLEPLIVLLVHRNWRPSRLASERWRKRHRS